MNFTKFGGRRFLMCMGNAAICTLLLWFDKISDSVFRDLILGTVAVYIAGNGFQKWKEANNRVQEP